MRGTEGQSRGGIRDRVSGNTFVRRGAVVAAACVLTVALGVAPVLAGVPGDPTGAPGSDAAVSGSTPGVGAAPESGAGADRAGVAAPGDAAAVGATVLDGSAGVVYVDAADGYLKAAIPNGTDGGTADVVNYSVDDAAVVGPRTDIDGDGDREVPYVDTGGTLKLVDDAGTVAELGDLSGVTPRTSKSQLAIGDWDEDGNYDVFFASQEDGQNVYRVDWDERNDPPENLGLFDADAAQFMVGATDITGDGVRDLVFTSSSDALYYVNGTGDEVKVSDGKWGTNANVGLGEPDDLNGSSGSDPSPADFSYPAVSSGQAVRTLANGETLEATTLKSGTVATKTTPTAADWTGDGAPDHLYIDTEGEVRYVQHPDVGTAEGHVLDLDGNRIAADASVGLVSRISSFEDREDLAASGANAGFEVYGFSAANASTPDTGVEVGFKSNKDVENATVRIEGNANATVTRGDLTKEMLTIDENVYNNTTDLGVDGEYTVTFEEFVSVDGETVVPGETLTVVVDASNASVTNATLADATDGNGAVTDGDEIEVAADVANGADATVTADLSAFGAGEVELTDAGDRYVATATVDAANATDGTYDATVVAAEDGEPVDADATGALTLDATPPTVSNASLVADGQDVDAVVETDEPLDALDVGAGGDAAGNRTLANATVTEANGTYTYRVNVSDGADGTFEATLYAAADAAGNDGAGGETDAVTVDTTPPAVLGSDLNVTNPDGQNVTVSFRTDEPLADVAVEVAGAESATLTEADFAEREDGGEYVYEATYEGGSDGDYEATLTTAADAAGNDGAGGENGTVAVDTTPPAVLADSFDATNPTGRDVTVTFRTDEPLADVAVEVAGAESATLTEADFAEREDGGEYVYEATYEAGADGEYDATLEAAADAAGNDGAGGETDAAVVDTPDVVNGSFAITQSARREVTVAFETTAPLDGVAVSVTGPTNATLNGSDFAETVDGNVTYEATLAVDGDGDYAAALENATADGVDVAGGESDAVTVDAPTVRDGSFEAAVANDTLTVSFRTDTALSGIDVALAGAADGSLDETDFAETVDGEDYVYEATVDGVGGATRAELVAATDADGIDGAAGEADAAGVTADARATSALVGVGSEVGLSANDSDLPPDAATTYTWVPEGQADATGETATVAFDEPGEYAVELAVEAENSTFRDDVTITVEDREPPVARVGVDRTASVGETVTFDAGDTTDDVGVDAYEWDFDGDGAVDATGASPSHAYDDPGVYDATVTARDAANNTETATVTVEVVGPDLETVPAAREFPDTAVGSTALVGIELTNGGTAPLNVSDAAFSGADPGDFALAGAAAEGLPAVRPGETVTVLVGFTPGAAGDRSATLELTTNDTDAGTVAVDLAGAGADSALTPESATVSVGEVSVGDGANATVTLTNAGDGPVDVTDLSVAGDGAGDVAVVDAAGLPDAIPAGESRTVTVRFEPSAVGEAPATLAATTADGATVRVALDARGTGADAALPDGAVAFGDVGKTETATRSVTVANYGDEPLAVDDVRVMGADADAFAVANAPTTLAPGETATVDVTLDPDAAGDVAGTLVVDAANGSHADATAPVTGEAVAAEIGVDRRELSFEDVPPGETAVLNVTVRNLVSSEANLTVSGTDLVGDDPGAFAVVGGGAPFTLAPGENRTVRIAFAPESEGVRQAQLRVRSDAADRPQIDVWLSNTGTYLVVQEVDAGAREDPTVNVDAENVDAGDGFTVDVAQPGPRAEPVTVTALSMGVERDGGFEMDVRHAADAVDEPYEPPVDRRTLRFVELAHEASIGNANLSGTGLRFTVAKDALPDGAAPDEVAFRRFNDAAGEWRRHEPTLVGETDTDYVFSVDTPGFSEFVITGPTDDGGSTDDGSTEGGSADDGSTDGPTGGDGGSTGGTGGGATDGPADVEPTLITWADGATRGAEVDGAEPGRRVTATAFDGDARAVDLASAAFTLTAERATVTVTFGAEPPETPAVDGGVLSYYRVEAGGAADVRHVLTVAPAASPEAETTVYRYADGAWVEADAVRVEADGDRERYAVAGGEGTYAVVRQGYARLADAGLERATATPGEAVVATATLVNDGAVAAERTLELRLDGETVATRTVTVEPGAERTVRLSAVVDAAGSFAVTVDGEPAGEVTVTAAATPRTAAAPTWLLPGLVAAPLLLAALLIVAWRRRDDEEADDDGRRA